MSATVEAFIAAARAALPQEPIDRWQVRGFGNSAEMSNVLIDLIRRGEKTGTFALESEFATRPNDRPVAGACVVVTHFDGLPALLYRLTEVTPVAFEDIGAEHVAVEGPNARNVEVWRQIHWPYFGALLRARNQQPAPRMTILFQRFTLLYPLPTA